MWIVDISIGTYCVPLVADLFCFVTKETPCCLFLSIIRLMLLKNLNLDDILYVDNCYVKQDVSQIHPT